MTIYADSGSAPAFPWYGIVDGSQLEQGDLLREFPLLSLAGPFEIPLVDPNVRVRIGSADIIIMSQSCDLSASKIENVLLCPHFFPAELGQVGELSSPGGRRRIRDGSIISLYSLPPCEIPGFECDTRIVNFRQLTTAPFPLVEAVAQSQGRRLRLLPPYREHLAQALSRFLGRVGLPTGYPEF